MNAIKILLLSISNMIEDNTPRNAIPQSLECDHDVIFELKVYQQTFVFCNW